MPAARGCEGSGLEGGGALAHGAASAVAVVEGEAVLAVAVRRRASSGGDEADRVSSIAGVALICVEADRVLHARVRSRLRVACHTPRHKFLSKFYSIFCYCPSTRPALHFSIKRLSIKRLQKRSCALFQGKASLLVCDNNPEYCSIERNRMWLYFTSP